MNLTPFFYGTPCWRVRLPANQKTVAPSPLSFPSGRRQHLISHVPFIRLRPIATPIAIPEPGG